MRRLRQLTWGLAALAVLTVSAAPARAQGCGITTTDLVAGQNYHAGSITISHDASYIYVQYNTDTPWVMSDAHVAVASTLAGIPQTKAGNPIPGRFAYSATFDPEVTSHTFVVPVPSPSTGTVVIAAHALVQAPKAFGGSQTGWGAGTDFPGSNWATYITYTVESCGGGGGGID
jgi:hypothetical protein